FGCHVSIIDRNPRILKVVDEDVGALITDVFKREGMQIYTDTEIDVCEALEDGRTRICVEQGDGKKTITARSIFVALGRAPNVTGLGLEQVGVVCDDRHCIQTN
ncbi:MAG: FAD-dependent oxidoreductase, partial [Anaerolineales bacterium]|nr:FAD-dependent oxidoreductase [Anaerolineales bacterium]